MNSSQEQVLKAWIPSLVWLGLIAIESTNWLSSANTNNFLYPIFHFLTGVDPRRFGVWNEYFRKVGHFVGYFALSWLLFGAWRATLPQEGSPHWSWHWARVAFFMSALVATLDEWHQTYLASRTGNARDVLLDTSAVVTAQIVIWMLMRRRTPARGRAIASGSSG